MGIDSLAGSFNQENPQLHLQNIPLDHEAFKQSILTTLKSGNPPELYTYWAGSRTKYILSYLEPLDDVWEKENLDEAFSESLIQAASVYEGKKYLIPLTQHYVGFFYNRKVFLEAGITPPATWKDFLTVCEILKNKGITPLAIGAKDRWPAQFWFDYLILRTAGPDFREQLVSGKIGFHDPKVLEAFSLWKGLLDKGYINQNAPDAAWDTQAGKEVLEGSSGMTLMGTWLIGYYNSFVPETKNHVNYGFFSFPVIDPLIPKIALGPVDGVILPRGALNIPGAKKVLGFLAGETAQKIISHNSGALSPLKTLDPGLYSPLQNQIRNEIANTRGWAFNYDLATPPQAAEIGLDLFVNFLKSPENYTQLVNDAAGKMKNSFTSGQ